MQNKEKTIHIITLNIPDPPDYGGMIDSYYRIKELYSLGIKIHLHCFVYNRNPSKSLDCYCESVHYYSRNNTDWKTFFSFKPFIVNSRNSENLLQAILKDNSPVLFDGIHTTFQFNNPGLNNRIKAVRVHNIEHRYYLTLFKYENNIFKKIFFLAEAIKLKYYEKILLKANFNFTVSPVEQSYFQSMYNNAVYVPSFHPFNKVVSFPGKGTFVLFHADLSVIENVKSCIWLITHVFSKTKYPCIIAGKNPPRHLQKLVKKYSNIIVSCNPTNEQMSTYIRDAHIHVLIALKNNGLKLKLLISLFSGRFCLVNPAIVEDTILDKICQVAKTDTDFLNMIDILMNEEFTKDMIEVRETLLNTQYNNRSNALKFIDAMGI
jgi:hypothetical protein